MLGQLDEKVIIPSPEDIFNEQLAVNREWMYIKHAMKIETRFKRSALPTHKYNDQRQNQCKTLYPHTKHVARCLVYA